MAELILDGFDQYGPNGSNSFNTAIPLLTTLSPYYTNSLGYLAGVSIGPNLGGTGQSLQISGANGGGNTYTYLSRSLGSNVTRIIGGMYVSTTNLTAVGISFVEGASEQCCIMITATTGIVKLLTNNAGSAIATSTIAVSPNTSVYMSWDITIGASASYQVWINGASVFSGVGNTRNGTANSYCNSYRIQSVGLTSATYYNTGFAPAASFDHLHLFDSTGSANNSVSLAGPYIATDYPIGDYQTQFTNSTEILGNYNSTSTSTNAPGAATLFLLKVTTLVALTINSVGCLPAATSGANFMAVIYSDSSGSPGTLLSSGPQTTGTTANTILTGALTTPQSLTAATPYWIGFITDTSVALNLIDGTSPGVQKANTYASGAPASPTGFTTARSNWIIWGNCSGALVNWESQINSPAPGDLSYVSSNTVGAGDLFNFPSLPSGALTVLTSAVTVVARKNDAGMRYLNMNMSSGGVLGAGSKASQPTNATYGSLTSFFGTDPNTTVSWTISGLNAAKVGFSVAA